MRHVIGNTFSNIAHALQILLHCDFLVYHSQLILQGKASVLIRSNVRNKINEAQCHQSQKLPYQESLFEGSESPAQMNLRQHKLDIGKHTQDENGDSEK